ncbi:lipopolysaccharide-induced tumor necrosis factor-alpha factor homolog [Ostrinia furnacalis]|uniref:lipopolysaccharide-induced tumor necrosis factor-alpha factor homolog n=1 Tax=Ostrinia furnacalis TaxID=93504 RepID=UPI00103B7AFE|nr:lipopolysaccharide-induced tumor necrosis factor-alpha factor homolog [Ostrinia furnacalis]
MDSNPRDVTINSGNHSVPSYASPAEIIIDSETVNYSREPPPPYTVTNEPTANQQLPVVQQTIIVQAPLKDRPVLYNCGICKENSLTKVEYVNTQKTHMFAGFICGCTLWCMMCCLGAIPYLLPTFKRTKHYCPKCNNFLGDYSRF